MNHRGSLIALCACAVTALVTATTATVTRAQDNTGADRPTAAPATQSGSAASNGVAPAPGTAGHATQASTQGVGQRGAHASRSTHSAPRATHNTQSASQPTSPPAGSDAKGQ